MKHKKTSEVSLVERGKMFCINHGANQTPYWGGKSCDNFTTSFGTTTVKYVCPDCVAKLVPVERRKTEVIDPLTGEKRKPGRPQKNPPKVLQLDENGQPIRRGRGRPAGAKNKATLERERMIREGTIVVDSRPKRGRGRPRKDSN